MIAFDLKIKNTNAATNSNANADPKDSNAIVHSVVPTKIDDPFKGKSLLAVGNQFINFMLAMIVLAAVIVIVIAGFRMVTGGGNPQQIAKAKKAILWAIVGLAVALMSFGIIQIVHILLQK